MIQINLTDLLAFTLLIYVMWALVNVPHAIFVIAHALATGTLIFALVIGMFMCGYVMVKPFTLLLHKPIHKHLEELYEEFEDVDTSNITKPEVM